MADIALDASPLSLLCHPKRHAPASLEFNRWLEDRVAAGDNVYVPEITDYEVRREMFLTGSRSGLRRLDHLQTLLIYLPLDTQTMRRAAQLWSDARRAGTPTADPREIDADVILAAQAQQVAALVVTDNIGHLSLFVAACHWRDVR
jgi:predicted nucleic acid-binding protein